MINKELIEEIVKEILRKIDSPIKNKLLVNHRGMEKDLESIEWLKRYWHVVELTNANEHIPPSSQNAVFLEVDQDLFVKAALGITDTKESLLFSKILLHGMQIDFILIDSLWRALNETNSHTNKRYLKMLLGYQNQLSNFGVRFFPSCHYIVPDQKSPNMIGAEYQEKLLTKAVIDGWKKDSITVKSNTIITPMAREAAKERKITILRGEVNDESVRND
nr:hypothetical protein [Neobacillus sp. Marseille-Q6967]